MTEILKTAGAMATSCLLALVLAALSIHQAPTLANVQPILTAAPGHEPGPPLYPLNDGREPGHVRHFTPPEEPHP